MNIIFDNLIILPLIISLIGAIIIAFLRKPSNGSLVAMVISLLLLASGFMQLFYLNSRDISYVFGGFVIPYGIEHYLDWLNLPLIFTICAFTSIAIIFFRRYFAYHIETSLSEGRQCIPYTLIFLLIFGFLGLALTRDLFNLYVFLEISSLSSYALLSLGHNRRALIGAFEYLLLGTIGATLILISIGLLFAELGTLNMLDIANKLNNMSISPNLVVKSAVIIFLVGALLKIAFFPLHIWMVKSYSAASPIILSFLASISGLVGFYIILRFLLFTTNGHGFELALSNELTLILQILGISAILFGSIAALMQDKLIKILLFSSVTHVGYMIILLSIGGAEALSTLMFYMYSDALVKFTSLLALNVINHNQVPLKLGDYLGKKEISTISSSFPVASITLTICFINNAGLPISVGFINKYNLLSLLINSNNHYLTASVIIGSLLGIAYNYRAASYLYFPDKSKKESKLSEISPSYFSNIGLISLIILNIVMAIYSGEIIEHLKYNFSQI